MFFFNFSRSARRARVLNRRSVLLASSNVTLSLPCTGRLRRMLLARRHGVLGVTTVASSVSQCVWWSRSKVPSIVFAQTTNASQSRITNSTISSNIISGSNGQSVRSSSTPPRRWGQADEITKRKDDGVDPNSLSGVLEQNETSAKGSRKRFKEIPVLPFILDRIVEMGVGIKPRNRRTNAIAGKKGSPALLSKAEERTYFAEQANRIKGGLAPSKGTLRDQKTDDKKAKVLSSCVPPPPFGPSHSKVTTHYFKTKNPSSKGGKSVKTLLLKTTTIRRPVKVLKSVASSSDELPKLTKNLPEIALAGRSNVGKSTLLNALLYGNLFDVDDAEFLKRREIGPVKLPRGVKAITSAKPGETKEITFYQLSSQITIEKIEDNATTSASSQSSAKGKLDGIKSADMSEASKNSNMEKHSVGLILADLPGYGFAYASEERAKEWAELMRNYLISRRGLKRMLLLIDARHGFKDADYTFLSSLEPNVPMIQIVLTKCDLVPQEDLARRVVQVQQQLSEALRREPGILPVMLVSAKAGIGFSNIKGDRALGGILELQRDLASLAPDLRKRR